MITPKFTPAQAQALVSMLIVSHETIMLVIQAADEEARQAAQEAQPTETEPMEDES